MIDGSLQQAAAYAKIALATYCLCPNPAQPEGHNGRAGHLGLLRSPLPRTLHIVGGLQGGGPWPLVASLSSKPSSDSGQGRVSSLTHPEDLGLRTPEEQDTWCLLG